ncbi:hypothetical protein T310_6086 [Rasamsonia emersonii CBS 393.64]|uniref:3-isopropylmalate dehydratase n=1 Tax=Rasamsonia emersonii (strain ATCC 16479 / CBS 393.64 / IMI 116815) TaxID=1408163 RepID=A0A0F4YPZ8_RASE3|nr:hypothetical protein T310_6086 [Rasamsonia emersonii CBS 393.64]KKA19926.1 hypothetical protein T310_6086 [Rasamsonia emersonii CBS 393.64]
MSQSESSKTARVSKQLTDLIEEVRSIRLPSSESEDGSPDNDSNLLHQIQQMIKTLDQAGYPRESGAFADVLSICTAPKQLGGLGLHPDENITAEQRSEIQFLLSAWLESLNSADRAKARPRPLACRPPGRRAMTLSEKIFAMHDIDQKGYVEPGQMIRVDVDWVIASEASWAGMERTYDQLGKPGIFRNDRFWLAGDHVVDPRVKDHPQIKRLIDASERAKHVFKMTEYQGMNYTIMHTEFYRERAQPGMLIIGSDSHTCSSGALGCLAIGLGAADVTMPLVTGETWFKVPECVNIRLVGTPRPGVGGKDVILYILKELKRNTVAADRVVEFTGPGLQYLSCDARFAISNMTTEFGGITGIFVPDEITYNFINRRRHPRYKNAATYFLPDADAQYAETHEIDLSNVCSFVARYPNPDDVIPVTEFEGLQLDGCFIGACTTAEEDLILAALVLQVGMEKKRLKPVKRGKRKVVPGSLPILQRLQELGLTDVYEKAGFEIGVPGCSYCVGSIGHISSAATVAASSFEMKITDPQPLIDGVDIELWNRLKSFSTRPAAVTEKNDSTNGPVYVEPSGSPDESAPASTSFVPVSADNNSNVPEVPTTSTTSNIIKGKVQRLGDFIDTDALAPAQFLVSSRTNEAIGAHCLEYTHPSFRARVKEGFDVVVAGKAFGCGSSREQAVSALLGGNNPPQNYPSSCGVRCVIAKSFAFIFARNAPNLGLLALTITDEAFYDAAQDAVDISVDLAARRVTVDGKESFGFQLSQMERELIANGGIASAFNRFGKKLFQVMCAPKNLRREDGVQQQQEEQDKKSLQW